MKITIPFGLILLALIAGYFLKPSLADHQKAADAWLEKTRNDAAAKLNLGDLLSAGVASAFHSGLYEDDLVFSRYTVTVGDAPYLRCFGIFKQVSCSKVENSAAPAP
jgi:hypothetical protein